METGQIGQNPGQIVSVFSFLYAKMDSEEMAIFVMLLCLLSCLTLQMKALQSFETLGTTFPVTQHHITHNLKLQ